MSFWLSLLWLKLRSQVGAGPVGLAAALSLAQNGVAIRVIEKQSGIPSGQRGAGIAVGHTCLSPLRCRFTPYISHEPRKCSSCLECSMTSANKGAIASTSSITTVRESLAEHTPCSLRTSRRRKYHTYALVTHIFLAGWHSWLLIAKLLDIRPGSHFCYSL